MDDAGVATDRAGVVTDHAGVATDRAGVATDRAGVATDRAGVATDRAGVATDHAGAATDHAGVVTDRAGVALDHAGAATDHAGVVTDHAGALPANSCLPGNPGRCPAIVWEAINSRGFHANGRLLRRTERPALVGHELRLAPSTTRGIFLRLSLRLCDARSAPLKQPRQKQQQRHCEAKRADITIVTGVGDEAREVRPDEAKDAA